MKDLQYVVTDLPPVWPGKKTQFRKSAPFKTSWTRTMHLLARETEYLGARKIEFALSISLGDLRQDGRLRADARPGAAVIVSFLDRDGQRQAYPCDRFAWWQDNLYAIAVVLEDLRRAERYGVQSALLRAGFKALPSSTAPTVNVNDAAIAIAEAAHMTISEVLRDKSAAKTAVQKALFQTHPDRNAGDRSQYDIIDAARRALSSHHGVSL